MDTSFACPAFPSLCELLCAFQKQFFGEDTSSVSMLQWQHALNRIIDFGDLKTIDFFHLSSCVADLDTETIVLLERACRLICKEYDSLYRNHQSEMDLAVFCAEVCDIANFLLHILRMRRERNVPR